jgi:hypothetical protein
MTSIIIDGYNVVGTHHTNMEKEREDFIGLMMRYKRVKSHDITVVFDGHIAGRGQESTTVRGGITIIFSGLGERADEVIKRIIAKNRREWIVVSSDREIIRFAWSVNSIPVASENFISIVSRETAGKGIASGPGYEGAVSVEELRYEGEYDEDVRPGKGNPHKFSKREKAVRRALSKL